MAEEPSLPPLPPGAFDQTENQTLRSFRKRVRGNSAPLVSTSSDPAVFSSDDDPALDNYMHGRRKKTRYVGTWFSQHPESTDSAVGDDEALQSLPILQPGRREFKRQVDSGVWLGSDGINGSESENLLETPETRRPDIFSLKESDLSASEELAHLMIQQCVDEGREVIDMTCLGLDELSNDIVEPLTRFALIPTVTEDVPFEHKDPEIELYLAKNSLWRVPKTLFSVEFLTVLSLRDNCLTELPPSICKLTNLQVLNVGQNNLQYLPAELLQLLQPGSKLRDIMVHPNPFLQPDSLCHTSWGSADYESLTFGKSVDQFEGVWDGFSTSLQMRSPVQYSDSAGVLCSDFRIAPLSPNTNRVPYEDFWTLGRPTARIRSFFTIDMSQRPSRVPTLFELALRAAARAPRNEHIADEIEEMVHEGLVSDRLPSAIRRAISVHQAGGQKCAVCKREVTIPQAEWLEWRELYRSSISKRNGIMVTQVSRMVRTGDDIWVPFIRRSCSWHCVPAVSPVPEDGQLQLADKS